MRLYRKVFPNKSKTRLDETVDIERDKQLIDKTSPIRTRIVRRHPKTDELIQVLNLWGIFDRTSTLSETWLAFIPML